MTVKGPLDRIVRAATRIEPHELKAVLLSFLFVFLLMAAYFILRPVRNAMASDWTDAELSLLWTGTFVFSLAAVTVYGAIIPRVRIRHLVPGVYVFFTLSFFAFYLGATQVENRGWLNAAFYVWVSVFSLFHVSVFWSFMADIYNREQAPRLFAFIAAGSSLGAITGPAITIALANVVGTYEILLVAAVMLLLPLPIIAVLNRLKVTELGNAGLEADLAREGRMARNPFRGFTLFFSDGFLFGIGTFIFLYVSMGTFAYFLLADLMRPYDEATRGQMWAFIDLTVNTLAVLTALFVTGRVAQRLGMARTLALVPAGIAAGFLVVAVAPVLAVVIGLEIARRAGNYAVTRPGREMLFTIVDRDRRFRAKPVIDIVIYRGGDAVWAWAFTGLTTGIGLGPKAVAAVGAAIALAWTAVAAWLGRRYDRAAGEAAPAVADQGERTPA
ncbi:MAG TPA: MFS transporter [Woeseiaceae bacterium]|nr:MFS transporter [Woeseiaceae bacterium]